MPDAPLNHFHHRLPLGRCLVPGRHTESHSERLDAVNAAGALGLVEFSVPGRVRRRLGVGRAQDPGALGKTPPQSNIGEERRLLGYEEVGSRHLQVFIDGGEGVGQFRREISLSVAVSWRGARRRKALGSVLHRLVHALSGAGA